MFKTKLKTSPNENDHHLGDLQSTATLIEYGDYQCSHCRSLVFTIDNLVRHFKNNFCFIYRHFPLHTIHPMAEMAAIAAEAADKQGKFWPMHYLLFQDGKNISEETIISCAEKLNLQMETFKGDLTKLELIEKVHTDFTEGMRSGVNGTPTLFLNGVRYNGLLDYDILKQAIEHLQRPKNFLTFLS